MNHISPISDTLIAQLTCIHAACIDLSVAPSHHDATLTRIGYAIFQKENVMERIKDCCVNSDIAIILILEHVT